MDGIRVVLQIFGWILWGLSLIFSLAVLFFGQVRKSVSNPKGLLYMSLVLLFGCLITFWGSLWQLHLVWIAPIAFLVCGVTSSGSNEPDSPTKRELDEIRSKLREDAARELEQRGKPLMVADNFVRIVLYALSIAMLILAMSAAMPFAYYGFLKWIVFFTCSWATWVYWCAGSWFRVISIVCGTSGLVELLGHFRRADWFLPNLISILVLILAIPLEMLIIWKARTERKVLTENVATKTDIR